MVIFLTIFITYSPLKSIAVKQVASGSMVPKLPVGSIVIVTQTKSITKGDIINFSNQFDSNLNITHRVSEVITNDKGVFYKTKGDANQSSDIDLIPANQVKGKVIATFPLLGHLYSFTRRPIGFIFLIILPALYIIISELLNIKKVIEEEAIKKHEKNKISGTTTMLSLLFLAALILSSARIAATSAYFSSGKSLASNFSTGQWNTDDDDHEDDDNCDDHQDYKDRKHHGNESCRDHKKDKHEHKDEHKRPKIRTRLSGDRHHYSFYLTDIEDFYHCSYEATYETDNATKGFYGRVDLSRQSEYSKENILLGSKSSEDGESYDRGVKNMKISITLTRPDGTTEKIESEED